MNITDLIDSEAESVGDILNDQKQMHFSTFKMKLLRTY